MATEEILGRIIEQYELDLTVKPEQQRIIQAILDKKDAFGLLPTGFGKSLTYTLIPLLLNEINPEKSHLAIVVSPLKALMKDQVSYLQEHNISAAAIMEDTMVKDVRDKKDLSVVFSSPEAAVQDKWRKILRDFQNRTCVLVFDEAHCISSWGLDFRPTYREVPVIQSYFDVPNLVLTATATTKIQRDIYSVLGMEVQKTEMISVLPDRPNIFLDVKESTENFEIELSWLLERLDTGPQSKKFLIYVRSINKCYQIYLWIVNHLLDKCFAGDPCASNRRIEMFHANTDAESKERIMDQFVRVDGKIELLISTVAFGMGVNIPNIDMVIHWGIPTSFLTYWQEVGRCARDGRKGYALCYAYKQSQSQCQEEELQKLVTSSECIRHEVLKNFLLDGMDKKELDKIIPTDICASNCVDYCNCRKCECCIRCQASCLCMRAEHSFEHFLNKR